MPKRNRVIIWTFLSVLGVVLAAFFGRILVSRAWSNAGMLALARAFDSAASGAGVREDIYDAEMLVQRALSLDARNDAAHRAMGFILWEKGDHEEAGDAWRLGGMLPADFERAARQARNADKPGVALDWYQRAIALDPARSDAYRSAAIILLDTGELEQAMLLIDKAIALDAFSRESTRVSAHYNRADILRAMGMLREAQAEYEWVLEHRPDDYWARVHLGWLAWELDHDPERAEALLLRAVELIPDLKWAYNRLGAFYEEVDRFADALRMYKKTLEIDPDDQTAQKRVDALSRGDIH